MPANPQIQKSIKFTLQAASEGSPDDFSADCIDLAVVPDVPDDVTVTTLDDVTHSDVGPIAWAIEATVILDWDSTRPGLARYLFDHSGEAAAFVHNAYDPTQAESSLEPEMTGTCRLVPIQYGGEGHAFAQATVRLPITGTPTLDETT